MNESNIGVALFSLFFAMVGIGSIFFTYQRRGQILRAANLNAKAIEELAKRDATRKSANASQLVRTAELDAEEIRSDAQRIVSAAEQRSERLREADKELQARLRETRSRLETMTDIAGEQAGSIEIINEDDLLTSQTYQEDRKRLRAELKTAAQDAVKNLRGHAADVNIGKYIGVSAKSDMAGALLVITAEMICAKVTPNNGHSSLNKMKDSIRAVSALLKAVDSRAELDADFAALLGERVRIEINYKRAKQVARDKQRELRAEQREEARARKEAEEAEAQALYEEELKRQAINELEQRMRSESEEERALHQAELDALQQELAEAHEKAERARSRAQDTKQGHVYVISNIGSFGDGILKIGMTRRLDPLDRVKELGDASVPFGFDIHALIESDDAPALENELHKLFDGRRLNKVNRRKEYFRVTINEIEEKLRAEGVEALVIPVASADEYYASIRLE